MVFYAIDNPLDISSKDPLGKWQSFGNTTEVEHPLENATEHALENATGNPRRSLSC